MSNLNTVVQALLKCGYLDVEFIEKELDDYQVDADDVVECHKYNFGKAVEDANAFIYCLYYIAFYSAVDNLGIGDTIDPEVFDTFCNCLDSHFYLKDNDGDWHEMRSYDEIYDFLQVHYTNPQDDVHNSK